MQADRLRAQQIVPVGPTPTPQPTVPQSAPGAVGSAPTGTPLIPLTAPTMRPNEPVTAGVNVGPGPGAPPPTPTADPERLRRWLPALEVLAEMPDASDATRNLVRYWRSLA